MGEKSKPGTCEYPRCERPVHLLGPLCLDHFEEFKAFDYPGDCESWICNAYLAEEENERDV